MCLRTSMKGAVSGTWTAYPSGVHEFTPGLRFVLTRSLVLCVMFIDRCLSFVLFLLTIVLYIFDLRILISSNSSYKHFWYFLRSFIYSHSKELIALPFSVWMISDLYFRLISLFLFSTDSFCFPNCDCFLILCIKLFSRYQVLYCHFFHFSSM